MRYNSTRSWWRAAERRCNDGRDQSGKDIRWGEMCIRMVTPSLVPLVGLVCEGFDAAGSRLERLEVTLGD